MKFGQIIFFTLVAVKLLFCTILSLAIITRVSFYFSMHKVLVPLDWIYKSVCYRTGMLPFDHLRGPVCNAPQVAFFRKCLVTSVTLVLG